MITIIAKANNLYMTVARSYLLPVGNIRWQLEICPERKADRQHGRGPGLGAPRAPQGPTGPQGPPGAPGGPGGAWEGPGSPWGAPGRDPDYVGRPSLLSPCIRYKFPPAR